MITEPHIKQASAPLSPVLEQAGEALPMVSEICSNEPMEQSATYNKECISLNAETATSNMTVTHKGRTFTDEANDFSLEIPEGAIPEGETLDVDFGVTLSGPFKFPVDLRPVSPVFWVCVQKKSQFSKPVTVTLPHFLDLKNDDDKKSLGLTFLKAGHEKNSGGLYEFEKAEGHTIFEPHKRFGVLHTTHLCSMCIGTYDNLQILEKTKFCITAVTPNFSIPVGEKAHGYFFLTFQNLITCLRRLDEIIKKMNLVGYEIKRDAFEFDTKSSKDPALQIDITQPHHGDIGCCGTSTVSYQTKMIHIV